MEKITILVTGDDIDFAQTTSDTLSAEGYKVLVATNNGDSLRFIYEYNPDLIVLNLDRENSTVTGFTICRALRKRTKCPIIVLSEKNNDENWINALTSCADNYIVKPFTNGWLLAVVHASLRLWLAYKNDRKIPDHTFDRNELVIDNDIHKVSIRGVKVHLTPLEFTTLHYLAKNDGRVISHEELINVVWRSRAKNTAQLRTIISQIRRKIEKDPTNPEYIITVPGFGYRLNSKEPIRIK